MLNFSLPPVAGSSTHCPMDLRNFPSVTSRTIGDYRHSAKAQSFRNDTFVESQSVEDGK